MTYTVRLTTLDSTLRLRVGELPALFRLDSTLPVNVVSLTRLLRWFPGTASLVQMLASDVRVFKRYGGRYLHFIGTHDVSVRFEDLVVHLGFPPRRSEILIKFDVVEELIDPLLGKSFLDFVRGVHYYEHNILLATVGFPDEGKSLLANFSKCFHGQYQILFVNICQRGGQYYVFKIRCDKLLRLHNAWVE